MPGQIPEATMRSPFALTLALVATSGLAAQEGHEQHAEHLGRVRFPVSCNTEAQRRFERGVALLHSFWYEKECRDRKSTRLNSSHSQISYAVFCLKKKKKTVYKAR